MASPLQFSDTTTKQGLVQFYEKEIGADYGDVSGDTEALYEFTARSNVALQDFLRMAIDSSGTMQFDDTSTYETDGVTERGYPILTANLISSQRDYKFVADGVGNLILDIHKVLILPSSSAPEFVEIDPIDELREQNNILKNSNSGVPSKYGKLSNGLFLDPPTGYSKTGGLKMVVSRETTYFTSADTTKRAGIPAIFHKYLYLKPAMEKGRTKTFSNYALLRDEVLKLEGDGINPGQIQKYFASRERDVRKGLKVNIENTR